MYKNLNTEGLGISGRQSELIELTLSYGFKGLDLDIEAFQKQAETRGLDYARRLLDSAKLKIGGFDLPVAWQGDDGTFKSDLERLPQWAQLASEIGATGCRTTILPACDDKPYHENFEFHRHRLTDIAEALAPYSIRLGLDFIAPAGRREGRVHQFISTPDALLLLIKTTGVANIGVVVDLWHWHVGGGTLDQLSELKAEQIVMVRVADVPDDVELESIQEHQRLLPGESGVVDTVAALTLFSQLGYDGPVTPLPDASQFSGMTRDRIVRQSSETLGAQMKAAKLGITASEPAAAGG